MTPPKEGNPLKWGLVASIGIGLLAFGLSFAHMPKPAFPDPGGAMVAAFSWGYGLCIVKDNVAFWLHRRTVKKLTRPR